LTKTDPKARIDPGDTNDVLRLWIRDGTLEVFRIPGSDQDDPNVAILSRLHVDYSGTIEITLSTGDWIRLEPGTEIALGNAALKGTSNYPNYHFYLYSELVVGRKITGNPPTQSSTKIKTLESEHPVFKSGIPIYDGNAQCGNQGCC